VCASLVIFISLGGRRPWTLRRKRLSRRKGSFDFARFTRFAQDDSEEKSISLASLVMTNQE
jgi:hypothetical protein